MTHLRRLQRRFPLLQLAGLAAVVGYGLATIPGFGQWSTLRLLLSLACFLALAALGPTIVILVGGIDFSVPGFIVLGAIVATRLHSGYGWHPVPAILAPILMAALAGSIVGWAAATYRLQPLVLTLAVGVIASGSVLAWVGTAPLGSSIPVLHEIASPGASLADALPVPPLMLITVAVTVGVALLLHRTIVGRRLFAVGANPLAAHFARVSPVRVWSAAYATSAAGSAAVGVLLTGFSGASAALGDSYLFSGLTAVIVGGTTFGGSRGDFTHTVVGALLLTFLTTILVASRVPPAVNQILFGALILVAVAGFGREQRLRDAV